MKEINLNYFKEQDVYFKCFSCDALFKHHIDDINLDAPYDLVCPRCNHFNISFPRDKNGEYLFE